MSDNTVQSILEQFGADRDLVVSELQRIGIRDSKICIAICLALIIIADIMVVWAVIRRVKEGETSDTVFIVSIVALFILCFGIPFFVMGEINLSNWTHFPIGMAIKELT